MMVMHTLRNLTAIEDRHKHRNMDRILKLQNPRTRRNILEEAIEERPHALKPHYFVGKTRMPK
jgi:hypothetical protein